MQTYVCQLLGLCFYHFMDAFISHSYVFTIHVVALTSFITYRHAPLCFLCPLVASYFSDFLCLLIQLTFSSFPFTDLRYLGLQDILLLILSRYGLLRISLLRRRSHSLCSTPSFPTHNPLTLVTLVVDWANTLALMSRLVYRNFDILLICILSFCFVIDILQFLQPYR